MSWAQRDEEERKYGLKVDTDGYVICDGTGRCLVQKNIGSYKKSDNFKCQYNCQPIPCKGCSWDTGDLPKYKFDGKEICVSCHVYEHYRVNPDQLLKDFNDTCVDGYYNEND